MKKIKLLLFFLVFASSAFAQQWLWGRDANGTTKSDDIASVVATDKHGNAYLAGYYEYSVTFGSYTLTDIRDNAFLVKYNSSGTVIWAVQAGYSNGSYAHVYSVATDTNGNIYISGCFTDTLKFGNSKVSTPSNNAWGLFIAKYDSNGNALWVRQAVGGGGVGSSVATDNKCNVYLTGWMQGLSQFGSYTLNGINNLDMFVVKYDPNGNVKWAKQSEVLSYQSSGGGHSVHPDKNGNVYVTGVFNDTIVFGTKLLKAPAGSSMFLVKYDSSGNFLWATNPTGYTQGFAVITDNANNIFITGYFKDSVNFGGHALTGISELFLTKYNPTGNVIWAKQSTSGILYNWAGDFLSTDANENIYLAGWGNQGTMQFGSLSLSGYNNPSFIMKLDSAGNSICGSILNNGNSSLGTVGIASDSSGNFTYLAGTFSNDSIILGPNTLITASGGNLPYLGRWQACTSPIDTNPHPVTKEPCGSLFIPDAFSPNGDGENDILYVRDNCIVTMDFIIYDRWGNKVFESKNQSVGWDGAYMGKPMTTGTYVWYLTAQMQDGSIIDKKGSVALVR